MKGSDMSVNPEETSSILSFLTFGWLNPLIKLGASRPLEFEDMFPVRTDMASNYLNQQFILHWGKELEYARGPEFGNDLIPLKDKKGQVLKPSLVRALWGIFKVPFSLGGLAFALIIGLQYIQTYLLKWFISFVVNSQYPPSPDEYPPESTGYILAVFMLVSPVLYTIGLNYSMRYSYKVAVSVRAVLITQLFRKSIKLSTKARGQMSTGQIVNMMSTDADKVDLVLQWFHYGWTSVISLCVAISLLIATIGPSALAGFAVIFILMPFQGKVWNALHVIRMNTLKCADKRIKLMNEILQGIRVIKSYAWEVPFFRNLTILRKAEMESVLKNAYVRAINSTLMQIGPVLMSVISFLVLGAVNNGQLDPAETFTALTLFNFVNTPLIMLPLILSFTADAMVSVHRIQDFLLAEELQQGPLFIEPSTCSFAIKMENGSFAWENVENKSDEKSPKEENKEMEGKADKVNKGGETKENAVELTSIVTNPSSPSSSSNPSPAPLLNNLNFEIKRGKLTLIVGSVGSGKSSFLNALIGEMKCLSGQVQVAGTIGYVSQTAWIQNASLRENILFGLEYDEKRYNEAIRVSCLSPDLRVLPAGDKTEIGEKGINLSGGQKQRVSLARAVYFNADIILLDDPLSALDAHVGKTVFEEMILGSLGSKTRILVTHQLQYAPRCDEIFYLRNGVISEKGTYAELMENPRHFANLMDTYVHSHTDSEAEESDVNNKNDKKQEKKKAEETKQPDNDENDATLMSVEHRARGGIPWSVYFYYLKALGGPFVGLFALITISIANGVSIYNNYWLSAWTSDEYKASFHFYMYMYAILAVVQSVCFLVSTMVVARIFVSAAIRLHDTGFEAILHAPIYFFDTTPLGRIMNRFSKDQDVVDTLLQDSVRMFANMLCAVLGTLGLIAYVEDYFLIGLVPMLFVYLHIQALYRRGSREIKRLDTVSRSPLYSHFTESLTGLPTIRAYNQGDRFVEENFRRVDRNNRPYYASMVSQRWLAQYLEVIGALLIFTVAIIGTVQRKTISPGQIGVILSYAMNMSQVLAWMVRQAVEAENHFNSVERSKFYAEDLPREKEYTLDTDNETIETGLATLTPALVGNKLKSNLTASDWPAYGLIQFQNVSMRYREGLPLVLNDISASIQPGEKIGVVGRTGAGKSSCMVSLFRLVELASGKIFIDGVDIAKIGLHTLRSKMAIIPQDPVLYSGTIRSNLDPFNQYSDKDLWFILEKCFLKEAVVNMEGQLDAVVIENGENLSVGQKCQICLGRAMLRKTKILIMDEATASVDLETDSWIQESLRTSFDCTIITIAHRLNTIIDYDRVLVLDHGRIAEFDSPASLLRNASSIFTGLVQETGPDNAALLTKIANEREEKKKSMNQTPGKVYFSPVQEQKENEIEKTEPSKSRSIYFHF